MKSYNIYKFKVSEKTNQSKIDKLDDLSYQWKKLCNFVIHKMQFGEDENIYDGAKEQTPLTTSFVQQSISFCERILESDESNNSTKNVHFSDSPAVQLDSRILDVFKHQTEEFNTWAKFSSAPYDKFTVPILGSEDQIAELRKNNFDFQQAHLKKEDRDYFLHLVVSEEQDIPESEDLEHFIGIDLGINSLACLSVLDENGEELQKEEFDSSYYMEKVKYFNEKIAEFQSKGLEEKVSDFYEKKKNFTEDYLHKLSRKIVDIASKYENSCVVMEKLKGLKDNCFNQSGAHNKRLNKWHYRKLIEMIKYKAHQEGIAYRTVSPALTSQVCKHCQKRALTRCSGNASIGRCESCNTDINNMDLLASVNVVRRLFFYMESKSSCIESSSNEDAVDFEGFTEANQFGFVEQLRSQRSEPRSC